VGEFVGAFPGAIPPMIGWVAATADSTRVPVAVRRFFSSGNFHIFTPLPGCIGKTMARAGI